MDDADDRRRIEQERYRTLLEINNALISNLTRDALFHAIAQALHRVLPFDRAAIFLHHPPKDVLRLFVLESSLPSQNFVVGMELPLEGTHVGWVFWNRCPLLRHDLEMERRFAIEDLSRADGVRSYVMVPLIARGAAIGVLAAASIRPKQYSRDDIEFFQEVAKQVALAVENMKAYEDTAALSQAMRQEAARRAEAEEMLRATVEGTAPVTGSDFFYSLVRNLATALRVRYALVTEFLVTRPGRVRTLAFWKGDGFAENFEYDLARTPCREVLDGRIRYHSRDLQRLFPEDSILVDFNAQSFVGIPLWGSSGQVIGHLAVLDDTPMEEPPRGMALLTVFAARAGAELERVKAEESLKTALAEVDSLRQRLQDENIYLREEIRGEHNFADMVGLSAAFVGVLDRIRQVAITDSTVLITGETGTGKELIARAIHAQSRRKDRTLVKVNCSAISVGLVESELFGHVRGAFTGAIERRIGRFELANGATIFLDEVGDLPLEAQVKLLRVLQEQEFEPVGSNQTISVDVRVIAATNRDLFEAIRAGRFRADLFYRLNVVPIEVPPLRARQYDVPQLVDYFLERCSKKFGKRITAVTEKTMECLLSYSWPGNVRELQNVIERSVVLARGPLLEIDPRVLRVDGASSQSAQFDADLRTESTLRDVERHHITATLQRTGWVIDGVWGAAKILGLHPSTLRSRMDKLQIRRPTHEMP